MNLISKLIAASATIISLLCFADTSSATNGNSESNAATSPEKKLRSIAALDKLFPDALKKSGNNVFSFCPDSTCIEFINKNGNQRIYELITIYLYYKGDYFDLNDWRKLGEVQSDIGIILKDRNITGCKTQRQVKNMCLANEFKRLGVKVNNIRYDEGRRVVTPVWR